MLTVLHEWQECHWWPNVGLLHTCKHSGVVETLLRRKLCCCLLSQSPKVRGFNPFGPYTLLSQNPKVHSILKNTLWTCKFMFRVSTLHKDKSPYDSRSASNNFVLGLYSWCHNSLQGNYSRHETRFFCGWDLQLLCAWNLRNHSLQVSVKLPSSNKSCNFGLVPSAFLCRESLQQERSMRRVCKRWLCSEWSASGTPKTFPSVPWVWVKSCRDHTVKINFFSLSIQHQYREDWVTRTLLGWCLCSEELWPVLESSLLVTRPMCGLPWQHLACFLVRISRPKYKQISCWLRKRANANPCCCYLLRAVLWFSWAQLENHLCDVYPLMAWCCNVK